MLDFIKPYLRALSIAALISAALLIGFLYWRVTTLAEENKALETANLQLSGDLAAERNQVVVLARRETESKIIQTRTGKAKNEIKTKENGPVSPALRFAVDTDIVQ